MQHNKSGTFCSRICANSRIFSTEAKQKKSQALKGKRLDRSSYDRSAASKKCKDTWLQKYLATPFDQLGPENRRRRVFEEQKFCCARCGISKWFDQDIALELDHKDGNNLNNERNNLEGLCPNCHSQTDTWRGRNKPAKNGLNDYVSDVFLLECLKNAPNIRQGLLKAGVAAKGNNYVRAKKLLGQAMPD